MSRPARDNPFRVSRIEALAYRFKAGDLDAVLERFEKLGRRAALVGPKGSGKTTLLEEIERRCESEGRRIVRVRLRCERRVPTRAEQEALNEARPGTLVTVDGAEQLSSFAWLRLRRAARRASGLLITVHRPGRLPTLHEHSTDPALLGELVSELTAPGEVPEPKELAALFTRHQGNVRECLRELYDAW